MNEIDPEENYSVTTYYEPDSYRPGDWEVMTGRDLIDHLKTAEEHGGEVKYSVATEQEFIQYETSIRCPHGY